MKEFFNFFKYYRHVLLPISVMVTISLISVSIIAFRFELDKELYNHILVQLDSEKLDKYINLSFLLVSAGLLTSFFYYLGYTFMRTKLVNAIRIDISNDLLKTDYPFFIKNDSGNINKIIIDDTENIVSGMMALLENFNCIAIILMVSFIIFMIKPIFLVVFAILAAVSILLSSFIGSKSLLMQDKIEEKREDLYSFYWDIFRGIKEVKLNTLEDYVYRFSMEHQREYNKNIKKEQFYASLLEYTNKAVPYIAYIFLIVIGINTIRIGQMQPGVLIALIAIFYMVFNPLHEIANSFQEIKLAITCSQRFLPLRDLTPEEGEAEIANKVIEQIAMEGITFGYESKEILKDFSFVLEKGEKVGLVGKSGAGKSTISSLLSKLFANYKGEIFINDQNIREICPRELRKSVLYATQDSTLFNGTLRENLCPQGNYPDSWLMELIEGLNLTKAFQGLSNGLDTKIGDGACAFSGGETQRICIARALCSDAQVYIFDEATSALDPETEMKVLKFLFKTLSSKTLIFISHKVPPLLFVDKVYVLGSQGIIEQGTFAELKAKDSALKKIFNL